MNAFLHRPGGRYRVAQSTAFARRMLLPACAVAIAMAALFAPRACAQRIDFDQWPAQPLPDSAAPLLPAYGFNGDEFSIGAYLGCRPDSASPGFTTTASLWKFFDRVGIYDNIEEAIKKCCISPIVHLCSSGVHYRFFHVSEY